MVLCKQCYNRIGPKGYGFGGGAGIGIDIGTIMHHGEHPRKEPEDT